MAPNGTLQGSVDIVLCAGIKGDGRQKAWEDPEELDMHWLIWRGGLKSGWQCSWECIHPSSERVEASLALQLQQRRRRGQLLPRSPAGCVVTSPYPLLAIKSFLQSPLFYFVFLLALYSCLHTMMK